MAQWIDFKQLREKLTFEQVLRFYRVPVNLKSKVQHLGPCPLPRHNGQNHSPSLSAHLERGIFRCFGCGTSGNLLDFAVLMEGVSLDDREGIRRVALKLEKALLSPSKGPTVSHQPAGAVQKAVLKNAPLDFELKGLDHEHSHLRKHGLTPQTVQHFGLGMAKRGFFKDRLAIPLHHDGKLIGYCGRLLDDRLITEDNPRDLFPDKRERNGVVHEFHRSLFVYNGFRIRRPVADLGVTEEFDGVWWLHQNGWSDTVATMGSDCSKEQAELIVNLVVPEGRVWIISDGNVDGVNHALSLFKWIAPHRAVRWAKLPEGKQPIDLSASDLQSLLN